MSSDSFQRINGESSTKNTGLDSQIYDQEIHTIHIPEAVRKTGITTNEIIAEAIAFLHYDGIIILENAIDTSHLDTLNVILSREALEIAADPTHHFNFGKETQNMDQAPPPTRELMFKDVWCNPFAAAILAGMLGPTACCALCEWEYGAESHGTTTCAFRLRVCESGVPVAMVVNINLIDTNAENGATEIWVGSHHVSTVDEHEPEMLQIKKEVVEERRKHYPPVRACTKKGSLVIRDLRLWHAGMPNRTDEPRVMLAFVVQPAWFQGRSKIKLPIDVKDLVESWELEFDADWVDEVDHKKISSADVDFGSRSKALGKYQNRLAEKPMYYANLY